MTETILQEKLIVLPEGPQFVARAEEIAHKLGLSCLPVDTSLGQLKVPLSLWVGDQGIGLRQTMPQNSKPLYVDFVSGNMGYRGSQGRATHEMIVKAAGLKQGGNERLLDVTAGLGRDAYVLSACGYSITLIERSATLALMLEDGFARASTDERAAAIVDRMCLIQGNAQDYLESMLNDPEQHPDIIFMDPMFPTRIKSAKVKKDMQILQQLLAKDEDAGSLLEVALQTAKKRIVVKRPRVAPDLAGLKPNRRLTGKASRFDVYITNNLG